MKPCPIHTLVGPDMEAIPPTVSCEVCGYTEEADPFDVAGQMRTAVAMGLMTQEEASAWAVGLYGGDWTGVLATITEEVEA